MRRVVCAAAVLLMTVSLSAQHKTTKCTFQPFGQSCGPRLSAGEKIAQGTHIITFRVQKAAATSHGLLAIGFKELTFQFPGTKCFLHLLPRIVVPINTNRHGEASRTFARHRNLTGSVLLQVAILGKRDGLMTTNGLRVVCK